MSTPDCTDPCLMVIFGATGDLTCRKLIPALYNLKLDGGLPENFGVVGAARRDIGAARFRESLQAGVEQYSRQPLAPETWDPFSETISYSPCSFDDENGYRKLAQHLEEQEETLGTGGWPRGRIVEIFGPESSGKTTLTLHAIAEGQRLGLGCAFLDVEHAIDIEYAQALGVNLETLFMSQPETAEQA